MFLDLAFGIIAAIIFSEHSGIAFFPLLVFGLLFSVLPDLDYVICRIFKINLDKGYKHRDLFHYPLLYLPLGFLLFSLAGSGGRALAGLFLTVSLFHFLHDSIAYGRGVKWLYPFSKNYYAFFYEYSRTKKWGLWQWIFVFNEKNLDKWDKEHGDEDWLQNIYKSFHPIAVIEYVGFLAALIVLFFYLT